MARPYKIGLDYFPVDTDYYSDEKFQFIVAKCGLIGELICLRLFAKIYRNGYYTSWTEDDALLFAKHLGEKETLINRVIQEATKRGLFCLSMLNDHSILTSRGIQARYIRACLDSKRTNISIDLNYNLLTVNSEETAVNSKLFQKKPELTPEEIKDTNRGKYTKESKVKEIESKENQIESEIDEITIQSPFDFFLKQNEIFNSTNLEFLSSEEWFNVKAMQLGTNQERIHASAKDFIIDLRDRDMLEGKTLIDLRSHFVSWFKKHLPKSDHRSTFIPKIEDWSSPGIRHEKEVPSLEKYLLGHCAFVDYATNNLRLTTEDLKENIKTFQAYLDGSGDGWSNPDGIPSKFINWYQEQKSLIDSPKF